MIISSSQSLLADASIDNASGKEGALDVSNISPIMRALVEQAQTTLELSSGDTVMYVPDMPSPAPATVIVAAAHQSVTADVKKTPVIGVCKAGDVNEQMNMRLVADANSFFKLSNEDRFDKVWNIKVIQQPMHGTLGPNGVLPYDGSIWEKAKYLPNNNYEGNDSFVVQVTPVGGRAVLLHYFVAIAEGATTVNPVAHPACLGHSLIWRISSTDATSYLPSDIAQSWLTPDHSNITVSFRDIAGQSQIKKVPEALLSHSLSGLENISGTGF